MVGNRAGAGGGGLAGFDFADLAVRGGEVSANEAGGGGGGMGVFEVRRPRRSEWAAPRHREPLSPAAGPPTGPLVDHGLGRAPPARAGRHGPGFPLPIGL